MLSYNKNLRLLLGYLFGEKATLSKHFKRQTWNIEILGDDVRDDEDTDGLSK